MSATFVAAALFTAGDQTNDFTATALPNRRVQRLIRGMGLSFGEFKIVLLQRNIVARASCIKRRSIRTAMRKWDAHVTLPSSLYCPKT